VTTTQGEHPLDDLAVYAVDALDPNERAAVDAHLAGCASCRAELAEHLDTLARLTEVFAAPAGGLDQLVAGLDAPRHMARAPARPTAITAAPSARERRRRWMRVAGVAVAAAAVAAVVGVALSSLGDEDTDTLSDLADEALDQPDAEVATLATPDGANVARVVITDEGTGYLFADDLPTLAAGQTYQLWQLDGPAPVSLGVVGDGTRPVSAVAVPAGTTTMAISAEVAGGVVSPTADQIVASGVVAG
jgi:anti-sigma-K factor RskA